MFDRIRALFSGKAAAESKSTSARVELAQTNRDLDAAREAVKSVEGRVAHLKSIIDAGAAAERDLQTAIASPQGAAALAAFSSGEVKGPVARQVGTAERAAQAAEVARRALPEAEHDLAAAGAEVVRLTERKQRQIQRIVCDHVDRIVARRYAELFREIGEVHDHLVGCARGYNGMLGIVLATAPLEVPRFELPPLPTGDVFSTFLRHVPDQQTIQMAARAWSRFAARLVEDPEADVTTGIEAAFSSEFLGQQAGRSEHTSTITRRVRERNEPAGSVDEILQSAESRERRHLKIA